MKTLVLIIILALIAYIAFTTPKANPLQERAKQFLAMPVPDGMNYVPDSFAERFISEYAQNGKIKLDPELKELLEIVVMESTIVENTKPGTEEAYMNESAIILKNIINEINR